MAVTDKCPVCHNVEGGTYRLRHNCREDIFSCECSLCGDYDVDSQAYNWLIAVKDEAEELEHLIEITKNQRALISHRLHEMRRSDKCCSITRNWLDNLIEKSSLPTPATQAINIIRFIGDHISQLGDDILNLPINFYAIAGAPSNQAAIRLAEELRDLGLIRGEGLIIDSGRPKFASSGICLTLSGWQKYEEEKRGRVDGSYGFLAMQFDEPELGDIVQNIKSAIEEHTGYALYDMCDISQAGIIDNILRDRIRGAKFVIADLTHDNHGAYFEAGYAEGLDKPVIYICQKNKFESEGTHFDTNHCTTIPWSKDLIEDFCQELIATLRRSLD